MLVIDDESRIVELVRSLLEGEHEVVGETSAKKALEILTKDKFDAILCDLMMPELSGFEVLEALSRDPKTSGIPVVVLTARGGDTDQQRGLALGARRYMNKPFDVRDLIAEVQRQVGSRAAEEKGGRAAL